MPGWGASAAIYTAGMPDGWEVLDPPSFGSTAGRLAAICPSGALRLEDRTLVYDVGRCTACGRCAAEAPAAVRSSGEFELAAAARSELIKKIPIRGDLR